MIPVGTIINSLAIIGGSLLGILFHHSLPSKIKTIVFQGLGLATILIGMQMALKAQNVLAVVFSLLIGGIIGESLNLEERLEGLGEFIKSKLESKPEKFTEGFVAATLLYGIGSMAILGPIAEGLSGDKTILLTKSVLDGFSSIALASTYGMGVLFSFIPILIYQGSLTFLASGAQHFFSPIIMDQLTAVGGLLIVGISLGLLEIKKVKVANLLPALLIVVIFSLIFK